MLHTITTLPNNTTSEKLNSLIQSILSTNAATPQTATCEIRPVLTQEGVIDSHLNERIHLIQDKLICRK